MRRIIPIILWSLVIACALFVWFVPFSDDTPSNVSKSGEDGRVLVDVPWKHLPDVSPFKLTDQSGQEFDSRRLAGKPYVVSFFFASCPTICPKLNSKIQKLADEFDGTELTFISITCDPQNDTPEALKRYAESLSADVDQWRFLTGQMYKIQEIGRQFNVVLELNSHTDDILLVDRWGRFRDRFSWENPREMSRFKEVAEQLLAEEAPPVEQTITTRNALAGVPHSEKKTPWLDEFFLTDHQGDSFYSRDLIGQVWVGNFFFTSCPSICKRQTEYLRTLRDRLGDRPVHFVSISTDPKNDTPAVLNRYRENLGISDRQWHFLTGDSTYIRRISEEYFRVPLTSGAHHTSELFVVDRWGNVRGSFDWQQAGAEAELTSLIDSLLQETAPGDRFAQQ